MTKKCNMEETTASNTNDATVLAKETEVWWKHAMTRPTIIVVEGSKIAERAEKKAWI